MNNYKIAGGECGVKGLSCFIKSCIEGIENKEVSDYIEQFGSTWQQGYYYSKPVPIDRFEEVLREKSTEKE